VLAVEARVAHLGWCLCFPNQTTLYCRR
jgi:hypothetical protein